MGWHSKIGVRVCGTEHSCGGGTTQSQHTMTLDSTGHRELLKLGPGSLLSFMVQMALEREGDEPGKVQVHQNHFHQKNFFIKIHFHQKPLSSKTNFIKNQFHQKPIFIRALPVRGTHHPSRNNIVRVCVKASRAFAGLRPATPSHKHGLCPGFRVQGLGLQGSGFRSPGFKVQVFRVWGLGLWGLGFRSLGFRSVGFGVF